MPLLFEDAAKAKDAIMVSQQKEIQKLYDEWAQDIADRAKFYSHKTNASAAVSERYYKELYAQMKETSNQVGKEIQGLITSNMYTIADAVVKSNVDWLKEFGFSEDGLNAAFSYIPNDVVQRLVTGQIYQGGWNLSQRIWSDNQQTQRDIYQVMAKGLAEQKSVYEIAKDLEAYVKPSAKLPWNPVLAMRNTKTGQIEYKRIYKKQVDYNAQRLARTLAQHSYQQSFIAATKDNPFVTSYRWHSNGSRVCDLCMSRHLMIFKKDELPMDHPNGMCTMEPIVAADMVDQLADWFNSPDGTYPEIDAFAANFGYEAKVVKNTQDFVSKYGLSSKSHSAWYNSLTKTQKAEAKALKDASGLNWNDWYEKNIHSTGDPNLDFVKKYGTTTKSHSAWYNSLAPAQKAEAKLLKDQAGLTWDQWYEKYAKAGSTTTVKAASTATKQAANAFNAVQDKYLSPYGFTPAKMPKNFDDWSYKVSYEQKSEILKAMGTDWSDPHPYQQLMKYFNANLAKPGVSSQIVTATKAATTATKVAKKVDDLAAVVTKATTKADDVAAAVTSSTAKAVSTTATNSIDDAFDAAKWYDSLKSNDLREFNNLTKDWLKTISSSEKSGVVTYTGSAYWDMNAYLRGQQSSTRYKSAIEKAQAALSKASLPRETIVRRGADYNMLDSLGVGTITQENKSTVIGAVVQDKGFMSTSPAPRGGFTYRDIEYVIKLPKGSQAMYVDSISKHKGEEELLINCGGKFKVEEVEFGSDGSVNRIYMTLINLQ